MSKVLFNKTLKTGMIGFVYVFERLQELAGRHSEREHYNLIDVSEDSRYFEKAVDIIESWTENGTHYEIWHEVKTDAETLLYKAKRPNSEHWKSYDFNVCDFEADKGTGNLFIEDMQQGGSKGWIEVMRGVRPPHKRYIWYYLKAPQGAYSHAPVLLIEDAKLIEVFDTNKHRYKYIDVVKGKYGHGAGYLMPLKDVWKCPEHIEEFCRENDISYFPIPSDESLGTGAILELDIRRSEEKRLGLWPDMNWDDVE